MMLRASRFLASFLAASAACLASLSSALIPTFSVKPARFPEPLDAVAAASPARFPEPEAAAADASPARFPEPEAADAEAAGDCDITT